MRQQVRDDLRKSSRAFLDVVWPAIAPTCGGGEIIPVELIEDSDLASQMDTLAGIDMWQTKRGEGCRGIGSRVQYGKSWNTFTVRLHRSSGAITEWEKRKEAVKTGRWLYPYLTVQAYVDGDKLLSAGIVKTADLVAFIENAMEQGTLKTNVARDDGGTATFAIVRWADLPSTRVFQFQ
jgi:hypothetical protein